MSNFVKINASYIPYLEKQVIEEFANLKFYSVNNEEVLINPIMLAAFRSNVIWALDGNSDYSVYTEFSQAELQALQEFLCTGQCDLSVMSPVLQSMGIDLDTFAKKSSTWIKQEPEEKVLAKDDIVQIKEENVADYYDLPPPPPLHNFEDFGHEIFRPPKKIKVVHKPKIVPKAKVSSENQVFSVKPKSLKIVATESRKEDDPNDLPADFALSKPIDYYKKSPRKPHTKGSTKIGSDDRSPFCFTCDQEFLNDYKLAYHNFKEHEEYLKCPFCHKMVNVNEVEVFKVHIYNHQKESIECVQCGKAFAKPGKLSKHQRFHGPHHDDECSQCPQNFSRHADYKAHVRLDHPCWKHKCGWCKEAFEKMGDLKDHIAVVHRGTKKPKVVKKKYKPSRAQCDLCGKSVINLTQHLMQVHERIDQKLPCPHCDLVARNQAALQKHIEWFHIKDPCPDCGEVLPRGKMKRHKAQYHDAERRWKCDMCPKSFVAHQSLKDHRNIHTGEKPYKCRFCTACFASCGTHAMHQRGHLGFKRTSKRAHYEHS